MAASTIKKRVSKTNKKLRAFFEQYFQISGRPIRYDSQEKSYMPMFKLSVEKENFYNDQQEQNAFQDTHDVIEEAQEMINGRKKYTPLIG